MSIYETAMMKDEMALGIAGIIQISNLNERGQLRNLITFIIRHIVLKNRYREYGAKEITIRILKSKVKANIKEQLKNNFIYYRHKSLEQAFIDKFLIGNILVNGELNVTF